MKNTKARALTECAIMVALSFVLSNIPLLQMPLGGKVTPVSMLPVILVVIKYGIKWGLGTAFCYSLLQMLVGGVFAWGLTLPVLLAAILLDYILAYTVLGFAGVFGRSRSGVVKGTLLVCVLRFLSHFLSGFILWTNFDKFVFFGNEFVNQPVLYSVFYNGAYMLPETVATVLVASILVNVTPVQKLIGLTK